jgi:hypothetical protein
MTKKTELISFRTTPENSKYIRDLADSDERSLSYVLNKMLDSFRLKKVKKVSSIK